MTQEYMTEELRPLWLRGKNTGLLRRQEDLFSFRVLLLLGEAHASDEDYYQGVLRPSEWWVRLQSHLKQICLECTSRSIYRMLEVLHRQEDRRLRWSSTKGPMAEAVANSWDGLSLCLVALRRIEHSFRILSEGRKE